MTRRHFLATLGLTTLGTACVAVAPTALPPRKPNILLILADDLGWGDVRVLNPASRIPTRHLDRLARSGLSFTDAHAGSAACTPTRYGLLTGRHAFRNQASKGRVIMGFGAPVIEPGRLTLPKLLKSQGYATACFGKWNLGFHFVTRDGKAPNHLLTPTNILWDKPLSGGPLELGFDVFYGMTGSLDMPPMAWVEGDRFVVPPTEPRTNWQNRPSIGAPGFRDEEALPEVTRRTIDYIRGRKASETPFFVYMALPAPHAPIVPLPEYRGRTAIGPHGDYCVELDDMVGKVLTALDEAGKTDDTLVLFSSDNGFWRILDARGLEAQGHYPSGGFRGYKAEIHEGGHRVPLFIRWPGVVAPGRVSCEPVSLLDVFATCADILHVPLPNDAAEDSRSFLPWLEDSPPNMPLHPFLIHHSNDGSLAIRKGRWKLAQTSGDGNNGIKGFPPGTKREHLPPVQLFDMELDPHETRNVQAEHPELVRELSALIQKAVRDGRTAPIRPPL